MNVNHFKKLIATFAAVTALAQLAQANCEVPGEQGATQGQSQNIKSCMQNANYLVDAPDMSAEESNQELISPKVKNLNIANGADVYCRYHYQKQSGASAKFRCALTNEKNQLLDSKGNLVPEAKTLKTVGDDVFLADEKGNVINETKAKILKVRYHNGDKRNVENYSSTAASRILWLIGVPAHTNIMTNKITCFGCGSHPFKQTAVEADRKNRYVVTEFKDASIEVKFKGKRIYEPDQSPWGWADLMNISKSGAVDASKRIEIDVFALASQFLGYISDQSFQNAVVCTEVNKASPYICDKVVFMTHDIGAGLGKRYGKRGGLFGSSSRPRGDLKEFEAAQVFQPNTCSFMYQSGDSVPATVSKEGRDEFVRRAANLTEQNLIALFKASHISNLTARNAEEAAQHDIRWAKSTMKKLEEIKNAPCN
jgi:hypothetical protein